MNEGNRKETQSTTGKRTKRTSEKEPNYSTNPGRGEWGGVGVVGKWWAEGSEHAGGADPLDPRAPWRMVPAGPHGVGLKDAPSEAGGQRRARSFVYHLIGITP